MNTKKLPDIIHRCMTIGHLPTSYKISLTYEEQLLWFCHFLEDEVIPVVNNNSEVVQQLVNWFDTLDVQEEVNEKLDEMAESGELTEIIAQYLELAGILAYNSVEDLENAENLASGSFARTFGKITYNDGNGAYYKIREILNTDIIDGDKIVALNNYPNLVGEKIEENAATIDVVKYGIKNDGSDVTTNLQALIDSYPNGATFFFRNGTYYFNNISLPSNSKIEGENNTKFIIPTNEDINCLFKISNVENISFDNLYLQNGEDVNDGNLYGTALALEGDLKSCIYIENSENITMSNLRLDTYFDGLKFYNVDNVKILNCNFKDSGYSSIMVFDDSKNYVIENCNFDTAVNNNGTGNSYMIALTGDGYTVSTEVPTNIKIDKCNFYNCSWEGIDTHGGNEITITNCYFENIRVSIALFNDQRFTARHLHMHDIRIENNIIKGVTEDYGRIQVFGDSALDGTGEGFLCKNVIINNNTFLDCDTKTNEYLLFLAYCQNISVKDNIFNTTQLAIRFRRILYGSVTNNSFIFSTNGNPIELDGIQNVYFEKNEFSNTTLIPSYNIYGGSSSTTRNNVFFKDNVGIFSNGFIRNAGYAVGYYTFGLPVINTDTMREIPNRVVTSHNIRTRLVETMPFTVTGTSTNTVLTTSSCSLPFLPVGASIKVVGGGTGGSDLECVVLEYISNTQIRISTPLLSSVTNAQVKTNTYTYTDN